MRRFEVALILVAALAAGFTLYLWKVRPPWFERFRYPLHYSAILVERARANDIDPSLLAAVIYSESHFNPTAESRSGAIGLMQLTPDTAKGIAVRTGGTAFRLSDLTNPAINIRYGAWYLHLLLTKYGDERMALAAYNAGQGNVDRWRSAGLPVQFPETNAYVDRVEHLKAVYRRAWRSRLYG